MFSGPFELHAAMVWTRGPGGVGRAQDSRRFPQRGPRQASREKRHAVRGLFFRTTQASIASRVKGQMPALPRLRAFMFRGAMTVRSRPAEALWMFDLMDMSRSSLCSAWCSIRQIIA